MALSKMQMSDMLSVYGKMLTDKQREAITMYCDCDCSLQEIADEIGISRQGVRDAIVNGEKTFLKLEEALHLCEFSRRVAVALNEVDTDSVLEIVKQFVSKE